MPPCSSSSKTAPRAASRRAAFARVLIALAIAVTVGTLQPTHAQSSTWSRPAILASVAWSSAWDDETFLGRGATVGVGVSRPLGERVLIEATADGSLHTRDSGYLAARSTPIVLVGRGVLRFGSSASRSRIFTSGGLALLHSRGQFTARTFVADRNGFPVRGPDEVARWRVTLPGMELGAGVEIDASPRLAVRPEVRWLTTVGSPRRDIVEPPVWLVRAGATLVWRQR